MSYDSQDVDTLMRMVRRRLRAFGWEVEEAVAMISEAVTQADAKGMTFSQTQCAILEVLEQAYEDWESGGYDEDEEEEQAQAAR